MTLIARIEALMASDDSDDSRRLATLYEESPTDWRQGIDAALICLCGYSMETLLTYCKCGDCGHECARADLNPILESQTAGAGRCPECGALSFLTDPEDE